MYGTLANSVDPDQNTVSDQCLHCFSAPGFEGRGVPGRALFAWSLYKNEGNVMC